MRNVKVPQRSLYDHYTWPEIKALQKDDRVAVIPVGSVEQHGHHLPLDTDNVLVSTVCAEATRRAPQDILLMPLVPYGACEMTDDFAGTISISPDTLIGYVFDIIKSLARHGFAKVLIVNGHGGNKLILDMVARKASAGLGISCASVTYWSLIGKKIQEMRDSELGGAAHACEMETSLYLHIDSARVQKEKACKDIGYPVTEFFSMDFGKAGTATYPLPWNTFSKTGVLGDPTVATSEKGEKWLEAAADKLAELVKEFKKMASGRRPVNGGRKA